MQIRLWFSAAVLAATACAQTHIPGRLLVQTQSGADPDEVTQTIRTAGAQVEGQIDQLRVRVLRVPEHALERVRTALSRSGRFSFVEEDGIGQGSQVPNDPAFASQWHLNRIQGPNAWLSTTGAAGAPIAIIDSGIDQTHPDLAAKILPGWSFLTNTADTSDVLGHGTKTAGAAAAITNNALGVAGVAWANPIMPLVVLNSSNSASYSNIARAITWAADKGVRILSISISGSTSSSTLQSAVDYAWNKGSLVIAAAGNNGSTGMMYPAACKRVIAVGATDSNDALASWSNRGSWLTLVAPGASINTTTRGGGYGAASGTSFATPITAGVAALILSIQPAMSIGSLDAQLRQAVDDLGTPGFDSIYGAGRLNAFKAVTNVSLASSLDTTAPQVKITSPRQNATLSGTSYVEGYATDNVMVSRIELWVNGVFRQSIEANRFSFILNAAEFAGGKIAITVRAFDSSDNVGQAVTTVRK